MKRLSNNYHHYIASKQWQTKREQRKAIDKTCVLCNSRKRLTVHHRTYKRFGNENMNDLVTLCWPCHSRFERGKSWRKFWGNALDWVLRVIGK